VFLQLPTLVQTVRVLIILYLVVSDAEFIIEIQSISQTLQENIGSSNQGIFRRFPEWILLVRYICHARIAVQEFLIEILNEEMLIPLV
jgi:hypothetical protein